MPNRFLPILASGMIGLSILAGACSVQEPSPDLPGPATGRVASVEWDKSTPMLVLQNADGSGRVRVHFDSVADNIPGNYPPDVLPVADSTIRSIPRARWSPDGRYLAVVVAPASEALQVVLVTAEGRALRTVSPNSQYIWSDIEWSPDSRRIAYIMATAQLGGLPDLFITDLTADTIIRVTTRGTFSGYDVLRFNPAGTRLYFTEHLGWAPDSLSALSRLGYADLESGAIVDGAEVTGDPQGLSRDGSWGIFLRPAPAQPDQRELIKLTFGTGTSSVLARGDLALATMLDGDEEALLRSWSVSQEEVFRVVGLAAPNDVRDSLTTDPTTTWAAVWRETLKGWR